MVRFAPLAVLLLLSSTLTAETQASAPLTVEVTAEAPPPEASPADTVEAEDLRLRRIGSAGEALAPLAGVEVTSYGPVGAAESVSVRGSTSAQVLVLVDGVRVNDALSGGTDLSRLSLVGLEQISVEKGGGSSRYGADAVGGVVLFRTARKPSPLVLTVENLGYLPRDHVVGYGFGKTAEDADPASLADAQTVSLSWGPRWGDSVWRLAAQGTWARNAYSFTDLNLETRELENADYRAASAALGVTVPTWGGALSWDASGGWAEKGVPGSLSAPTPEARQEDGDWKSSVRFQTDRFFTDLLDLSLVLHGGSRGLDYTDGVTTANDGRHRLSTAGLDLQQTAWVSDQLSIRYGSSGSWSRGESNTVGSPTRWVGSGFVGTTLNFGPWSWTPSVRYDATSGLEGSAVGEPWGASVSVAYRLSAAETWSAAADRSYRVPSFQDLYWPLADGAEGNPDLRPETSYGLDLTRSWAQGLAVLKTSAYLRLAQDVILWQPGDDGVWRPSNFGAALYPGAEAEYKTVLEGLEVTVRYSFLYTYVLSGDWTWQDDKRLPMTPVHTASFGWGQTSKTFQWRAEGRYVGLRYLKTANSASLPAYFVADLSGRWPLGTQGALTLAADNLFGADYQTVSGYPMPGTRVRTAFEWTF